MARIHLSVDDELFGLLERDANAHNCTVNVYLITILEKRYKQEPFDYQDALTTLEREAQAQPIDEEFVLADLPSFQEISVSKAEDAHLKPSVVRARLGKMFNRRVYAGAVGDVERALDEKYALKFLSRAAVYIRKQRSDQVNETGDQE